MSTFALYNDLTNQAPESAGMTFIPASKLVFEVALNGGTNGAPGGTVQRSAVTLQGALVMSDGTIQTVLDVDLFHMLGEEYVQANGNHLHASARLTVGKGDVSPETWTNLLAYANECVQWKTQFRSGRLQLVTGSGAYLAAIEIGADSALIFDIVDNGETALGYSYGLDDVDLQGSIGFIRLGNSAKTGSMKKRTAVFAAAAPVAAAPQAVTMPPSRRPGVAAPAPAAAAARNGAAMFR